MQTADDWHKNGFQGGHGLPEMCKTYIIYYKKPVSRWDIGKSWPQMDKKMDEFT